MAEPKTNPPSSRWSLLVDGSLAEHALAAIREIVADLPDPSANILTDASLSGGAAGLAILCAYLSRAALDSDENATQFLERAMKAIATYSMDASLYSGFTGIAWATAHL